MHPHIRGFCRPQSPLRIIRFVIKHLLEDDLGLCPFQTFPLFQFHFLDSRTIGLVNIDRSLSNNGCFCKNMLACCHIYTQFRRAHFIESYSFVKCRPESDSYDNTALQIWAVFGQIGQLQAFPKAFCALTTNMVEVYKN